MFDNLHCVILSSAFEPFYSPLYLFFSFPRFPIPRLPTFYFSQFEVQSLRSAISSLHRISVLLLHVAREKWRLFIFDIFLEGLKNFKIRKNWRIVFFSSNTEYWEYNVICLLHCTFSSLLITSIVPFFFFFFVLEYVLQSSLEKLMSIQNPKRNIQQYMIFIWSYIYIYISKHFFIVNLSYIWLANPVRPEIQLRINCFG